MKKHELQWFALAVVLVFSLGAVRVLAARPPAETGKAAALGNAFTYQGTLKNNSGNPITNACDFQFKLYDAASSGIQIGSASVVTGVQVTGGLFTTKVNSGNEFGVNAFNGEARWLEIGVKCGSEPSFTQLSPLQELTPAPYAFGADLLDGMHASAFAATSHNHWGQSWSGSGDGLTLTSSDGNGLAASANSTTRAAGTFTNTSGNTSTRGWGVRAFTGQGAQLALHPGAAYYNAAGEFSGPNGIIAAASIDTTSGIGVIGLSTGTGGKGVYGYESAATGTNYGVYGLANSTGGTGIYGEAYASSGTNYGVYGRANSDSGFGGYFYNFSNGVGMYARSYSGNIIEGYGSNSTDREFVVSNTGNVYADGSYTSPAADFAELLTGAPGLEPGDVLVIGQDGNLAKSTLASQTNVVGVYSTHPGFVGGASDEINCSGKVPLAVVGVVPVKVCAENGPIRPGDLLTTSNTPGHAMRSGPNPQTGTILGKALQGLDGDTGVILVVVMLQ